MIDVGVTPFAKSSTYGVVVLARCAAGGAAAAGAAGHPQLSIVPVIVAASGFQDRTQSSYAC